jgi:tetratricopeptide (TPR) repeat protein
VLAFAVFSGATALLRARERERTTIAAVLAAATAYLVAAGVDWMWQLTAVSVVGVLCLGLLAGAGLRSGSGGTRRARRPFPRAVVVAGALVVIACEALPLLTDAELRASQAAASIGDSAQARRHARAAVALEPWAVSPYVQLALVEEQDGRLRSAATAIHAALRHNERDWRSWLIAARIETKRGAIDKAKHSLMQAKQLNPRSPIFASERDNGASR